MYGALEDVLSKKCTPAYILWISRHTIISYHMIKVALLALCAGNPLVTPWILCRALVLSFLFAWTWFSTNNWVIGAIRCTNAHVTSLQPPVIPIWRPNMLMIAIFMTLDALSPAKIQISYLTKRWMQASTIHSKNRFNMTTQSFSMHLKLTHPPNPPTPQSHPPPPPPPHHAAYMRMWIGLALV